MKISKEKFDKLPQLDRIEYRQIEDRIRNYYNIDLMNYTINFFSILYGFLILCAFEIYQISGLESFQSFLTKISHTIPIVAFLILISIFVEITFYIVKHININKLNEKYFKVEIK